MPVDFDELITLRERAEQACEMSRELISEYRFICERFLLLTSPRHSLDYRRRFALTHPLPSFRFSRL